MQFTDDVIKKIYNDVRVDKQVFRDLFEKSGKDYLTFINFLVKENYLERNKFGKMISGMIDYAYLPMEETLVEPQVLNILPKEICEKHICMAVYKFGEAVTVVHANPVTIGLAEFFERLVGGPVSLVFSFQDEIQNAIQIHYQTLEEVPLLTDVNLEFNEEELTVQTLDRLARNRDVIQLCDKILIQALKEQASDIHIEPKKFHILIRFRCNGVLATRFVLPSDTLSPVVSRFKVLALLDIANNKTPQDGRFDFELPQKSIDIRINVIPTMHGEKIALRLLGADSRATSFNFEKLGFLDEIKYKVVDALCKPNGLFLVTGPTGAGKTTTLHCALHTLSDPSVNIMAIEDPIEYEHPGITQISVNEKLNRSFSTVLRAILRQDPDIIMLGEIRDVETAKISANAALTGHLVLSSLHTNSAAQAVIRLRDMGLEHFNLIPSLIGVLGQRLVRSICQYCKKAYRPSKVLIEQFVDIDCDLDNVQFYFGRGCTHCQNTGYRGRVAIHEYLEIDGELRSLLLNLRSGEDLYTKLLQHKKYLKFSRDAFAKVLLGLTTIDELIRVVDNSEYGGDI